jgi:hypothetical protein
MFETELTYFKAHQDELVSQHAGKTLVLRGDKIEGVYKSALEAYLTAAKRFAPGTFMIQPCTPGPGAYTVTISSMNL